MDDIQLHQPSVDKNPHVRRNLSQNHALQHKNVLSQTESLSGCSGFSAKSRMLRTLGLERIHSIDIAILPILIANLKPMSYSVPKLSKLLVKNAKDMDVTKLMKVNPTLSCERMMYIRRAGKMPQSPYDLRGGPEKSGNDMQDTYLQESLANCFELLDDLFFFGLLKHEISLFHLVNPNAGSNISTMGFTFMSENISYPFDDSTSGTPMAVNIFLDLSIIKGSVNQSFGSDEINTMEFWNAYVGTLAHEMLHSFFMVYSCLCKRMCRHNAASPSQMGSAGHGEAWVEAARAIEEKCRQILGEGFCMGIEDSIIDEQHVDPETVTGSGTMDSRSC